MDIQPGKKRGIPLNRLGSVLITNTKIQLVFRLILGMTFMAASFYKIIDPASFAKSIWFYHMVPGSMINIMALILPWLELLCGVALMYH